MSGNERPLKAYQFLRSCAESGATFTVKEIAAHVGWKPATPKTYVNKKWRDYLISKTDGRYQVRRKFLRVAEAQFLAEFTQTDVIETSYVRERHSHFVQFEFLLPLTREDKLRRALDDLFYKDTIELRIQDVGLESLERIIPRDDTDESLYTEKVCSKIGDLFGGYSIVHVQGRYKAAELMSRSGAADYLTQDRLYLVDETTAAVRFIIPCSTGVSSFEEDRLSPAASTSTNDVELTKEVEFIRALFFLFFVEAVVATVHGEEEIWLLETGHSRHLYRWRRAGRTTTKKRKTSQEGTNTEANTLQDVDEEESDDDDLDI